MKAWMRRVDYEFACAVVFAETRNKARMIALNSDTWEEVTYLDMKCTRLPKADKYYNGQDFLDWFSDADRVILVRYLGFCCEDLEMSECKVCSAKDYCESYLEAVTLLEEEIQVE